MDYIFENESNITNSSLYGFTSYRIVVIAASGTAVLVTSVVLIIMLCEKAYRSILQRLFMWLVLAFLVNSSSVVASVFYNSNVVEQERACEYLGFLAMWSYWCSYTICLALLLYLVILVLTRTRNCPVCVVKIRNSRRLRVFLEVCTILGVLLGPLLVLWIPFHGTWYTYGFNSAMCAIHTVVANSQNKSSTDVTLVTFLYGDGIVQLTGLSAVLGAVIVLLNYCTLPANLRHAVAMKLTKNIALFFVAVIIYVVVYDMRFLGINFLATTVSFLPLVMLSTLLIIYLVAFHFSKLCAPSLMTLLKRKKEKRQHQRQTRDYGTLQEPTTRDYGSLEDSKTPSTHFTIPYTGQFTTITESIQ